MAHMLIPRSVVRMFNVSLASVLVPVVVAGFDVHAVSSFRQFFAATVDNKNICEAYWWTRRGTPCRRCSGSDRETRYRTEPPTQIATLCVRRRVVRQGGGA